MSKLVELAYEPFNKEWADGAKTRLQAFVLERYGQRAEKRFQIRVNGDTAEDAAPYAALISPGQPTSGPYGGMSLVLFPARDRQPALISLGVGTNGLAPDEQSLGRPGHARKTNAIARWLNAQAKTTIAWAKRDPVRVDLKLPAQQREELSKHYETAIEKYGQVLYATFAPGRDRAFTALAAHALADLFAEERGIAPLAEHQREKDEAQSGWMSSILPVAKQEEIEALLRQRRFVVLEGPPGTGKTRLARKLLDESFKGIGRTIQFHPGTTYESFIGGLAPDPGKGDLGLRFQPRRGHLMEAAALAMAHPKQPYLLHIDEINRADLATILGEAIYLFEPGEPDREVNLAYDFGPPWGSRFRLPENLFVLGTMNSADRSIAILDVAVRRRFAFEQVWPDPNEVKHPRMAEAFRRLFSIFLEEASDEAFALMPGHAYFLEIIGEPETRLRTELKPLLNEYLLQGYVSGFADSIRAYLDWLETRS